MSVEREHIRLSVGHSFRFLRWERTLHEVEMLHERGEFQRIQGEGAHWHYHPEMELTLFRRGEGTRYVGDQIAAFGAGDLVLLGSRLPHFWDVQGPSRGLSVQWHFPHGHPFWSIPECLALEGFFATAVRGIRFTGPTAEQLGRLMAALPQVSPPEQFAFLLSLFARMAGSPDSDQSFLCGQTFTGAVDKGYAQAVRDAVRFILANFREEVRLDDLLRLTGLSKSTFTRQFRTHSGKSYSQFLNSVRLQSACRLLASTDTPVTDIAFSNGFNQLSFFNRVFLREIGCNPSQYRNARRAASHAAHDPGKRPRALPNPAP